MLVLLGYAQVHQYGYEGQGDLPYWVQLMYSENPDMDQVIKEHIEYYKTHPFEKNAHTQYFKHWVHSRQIGTGIKTEEQIQSDKNYAQRLKNNLRTTSAGSWTCIGPFDYDEDAGSMSYAAGSAHVYTVEQSISNPNVLYAGTATAGIWKSTDKGMNWVLKTKDLMLTDVYSIEIDHTNENIVYAGASDGRLFKTTNGGNSWTEIGGSYFGANNIQLKI
ncbi:MAG TPA: hypothetical protein VIK89_13000 [Cytophagaceae bacterium]